MLLLLSCLGGFPLPFGCMHPSKTVGRDFLPFGEWSCLAKEHRNGIKHAFQDMAILLLTAQWFISFYWKLWAFIYFISLLLALQIVKSRGKKIPPPQSLLWALRHINLYGGVEECPAMGGRSWSPGAALASHLQCVISVSLEASNCTRQKNFKVTNAEGNGCIRRPTDRTHWTNFLPASPKFFCKSLSLHSKKKHEKLSWGFLRNGDHLQNLFSPLWLSHLPQPNSNWSFSCTHCASH